MYRKMIVALFAWVCIGFGSPSALNQFLSGLPSIGAGKSLTSKQESKLMVVAIPQPASPDDPAFEVFVPLSSWSIEASDVPNGLSCPQ